jgi:hypothetical protein
LRKELLNDVGGGELGFDVVQRVFLHSFNPKLFDVSGPSTIAHAGTRTTVAKEYIERGEQNCSDCAPTPASGSLPVGRGAKGTLFA